MPDSGNLGEVREAVLCLVNQERVRHGLRPLKLNQALQRAAQGHAEEMVTQDYFEHTAPDGESPLERIRADGYIPDASVAYVIGENLAWGTLSDATPAETVDSWIASPEHLANILNPKFTETAVGVVPEAIPSRSAGQPGAVYAQEFGVIEG